MVNKIVKSELLKKIQKAKKVKYKFKMILKFVLELKIKS